MNKQQEEIIELLADNICYSPQVQGMVIHGVIDKLAGRENRSFGRGMIAGGIIAFIVFAFIGTAVFISSQPAAPQILPDRPGIVIDTSIDDHSEIPDSIRQASPELQKAYDSSLKAREEGEAL